MATTPAPYPHSPATRRPDDRYDTRPAWDIGRPQPALLALADAGAIQGRVLDAGCGTGEHTLMAAGLGLAATGVDLASNALATARQKARERGLTARFLQHDALRLTDLGESFDTVLDCGLFHIFDDRETRAAYVDSLHAALAPGGRYFMLCFSDRQPEAWRSKGMRHSTTREQITGALATGWRIDAIDAVTIDALDPRDAVEPAKQAWLAVILEAGGIPAWRVSATRQEISC